MAKPLPGTGIDPALLQRAAEAIGLADLPMQNPARKSEGSADKKPEEAEAISAREHNAVVR
jgi:hypothetical protein